MIRKLLSVKIRGSTAFDAPPPTGQGAGRRILLETPTFSLFFWYVSTMKRKHLSVKIRDSTAFDASPPTGQGARR